MLSEPNEIENGMSRRWAPSVLGKYILLQLPSLALVVALGVALCRYFELPSLYAWAVVLLWVTKDVILYPFVWRAYVPGPQSTMVGLTGKAKEGIDPSGMVEIQGELWRAEAVPGFPLIETGDMVEVLEVRGLTVMVKPLRTKA